MNRSNGSESDFNESLDGSLTDYSNYDFSELDAEIDCVILQERNMFTADEMLFNGLEYVGFTHKRIAACQKATNDKRFVAHFGCIPKVAAMIFEDLQHTSVEKHAWHQRMSMTSTS